jgi:hypothetical protein
MGRGFVDSSGAFKVEAARRFDNLLLKVEIKDTIFG